MPDYITGRDPGDERDETPEVAGGGREALDLAEITRRLGAADEVVSALCEGKQRWTMSIPADIERDPDIVIARALHDARRMLALLSARPAPEREPNPLTEEEEAWLRTGRAMVQSSRDTAREMMAFDLDPIGSRPIRGKLRVIDALVRLVDRLRPRPEPVSEPEPRLLFKDWPRRDDDQGFAILELDTAYSCTITPVTAPDGSYVYQVQPASAEPVDVESILIEAFDNHERMMPVVGVQYEDDEGEARYLARQVAQHVGPPYASPPSERAGERELREALEEIAEHPTARHEGQHMCLYCNGDGHSPDEILHGEDCPIEIARRALATPSESGTETEGRDG